MLMPLRLIADVQFQVSNLGEVGLAEFGNQLLFGIGFIPEAIGHDIEPVESFRVAG